MRGSPQSGYRGPQIATGIYPNPVDTTNVLAKVDHQFSSRDQFSVRYSRYGVDVDQLARRRRPERADARRRTSTTPTRRSRIGNTLILSSRTRARNPRAVRARRPAGAAVGSDRPGGQHRRRRRVRHQLEQPDRPR